MGGRAGVVLRFVIVGVFVGALSWEATAALASGCGNAEPNAWLLGCNNNTATDATDLTNNAVGGIALYVNATGDNSQGAYIVGTNEGIYASGGAYGLDAVADTYGVYGYGAYGVYGQGTYGLYGTGTTNGVYATSSGGDAVVADLPSSSTGTNAVTGAAENGGNGVNAESNSPYTIGEGGHFNAALFAQNSSTGTAVWARNLNDGGQAAYVEAYGPHSTALTVCGCSSAAALKVTGRSRFVGKTTFSRSGVVTIPAGSAARSVTLAGVSASSMVLATAQEAASVWVKSAVPGSGKFTIHLTGRAPAGGLRVAYFVLN